MEKPNKSANKPLPSSEGFPKRADLAASRRRTLRLKIDAAGMPEFRALSKEQRENWREVLSHPETAKALEVEPLEPPKPEPIPELSQQSCGSLLDIVMYFFGLGAARLYHAPMRIAQESFALDETDKAVLIPPTQAVVSKYAPDFLLKYAAECELVLALGCVMKEKTGILRERLERRKQEAEKAKPKEKATTPTNGGATVSGRIEFVEEGETVGV